MMFVNRSAQFLRLSLGIVGVCLASLALETGSVSAGIYHWGDLSDAGSEVTFLNVEEDNGYSSPLYAPEPSLGGPVAVGNSLVLDPQNFLSQSSGGSQLTDSEFLTTMMVGPGDSINGIVVSEFGDYSLGGLPGSLATAQVGATFYWQVLEIDGVAVNMPLQVNRMYVSTGGGLHGGLYDLPGDEGITTPWDGSAAIDVAAYLADNLISGDATKVSLIFNNTLLTAADGYSSAFIKKKGVGIDVFVNDPFHVVPEPASILLLGIGLVFLGSQRRVG